MGEHFGINIPPGFDAGFEVGGTTNKYENIKSRIPLILDLLEHHWIEEPNLPFGRLLAKINRSYDYFYKVTDEEFLNHLEDYEEMGNE